MINDLSDNVSAHTVLYAYDTTFLTTQTSIEDLNALSNSVINESANWFKLNGFIINADKTQKIIFNFKNVQM